MRCPSCEKPLEVDGAARASGRAMCAHCHAGCDVVVVRSDGGGPWRSFEEVTLVADSEPAPRSMQDRSGRGYTRYLRIEKLGSRSGGDRRVPWLSIATALFVVTYIYTANMLIAFALTAAISPSGGWWAR